MPPNISTPNGVLYETDDEISAKDIQEDIKNTEAYKVELIWKNIILYVYLHFAAFYGLWLMFTSAKSATNVFAILVGYVGGFGLTAGAHRLWSHRSYKAKLPLRLFLIFCNTLVFEDSVIAWSRNHRGHHKFSETDADPHNAQRGFFFSHAGWLLVRKHPQVKEKGKQIDLSDLWADPILRFQKKYYAILVSLICFAMPTVIPMYFWGETFKNAFFGNLFRYCLTLNVSLLVNSVAHRWGNRPYDKFINPGDNLTVSLLVMGEGWHNYHHTFPWDYKTSELGNVNFTTTLINLFAKIGWAYDLKTVSEDMIKKRMEKTGEDSHAVTPL